MRQTKQPLPSYLQKPLYKPRFSQHIGQKFFWLTDNHKAVWAVQQSNCTYIIIGRDNLRWFKYPKWVARVGNCDIDLLCFSIAKVL